MVSWDIDYNAALGTVRRAAGQAEDYETNGSRVQSTVESLLAALSKSELVAAAVGDLAGEVVRPDIEALVGHSVSAVAGAGEAINFYANGQVEMAQRAQRNATTVDYDMDIPGGGN